MDLKYPFSCIWYVEARSARDRDPDGQADSSGSAVAVWLRKKPSEDGAEDLGRRYLLTCGHVIRRTAEEPTTAAENARKGFGPVLDEILVWEPGRGYTSATNPDRRIGAPIQGVYAARVAEIVPYSTEEVPETRRIASADWVILEVMDPDFQDNAETVRRWSSARWLPFSLIGYPAGAMSWNAGDAVRPTKSFGFQLVETVSGSLRLTGGQSRPGMSGGGLFDILGGFAGIHRSRVDSALEARSVSASHVIEQLEAAGYEVVEHGPDWKSIAAKSWRRHRLKVAAMLCVCVACMWMFLDLGKFGDACQNRGLRDRIQFAWSSRNLHIFRRELNGTRNVTALLPKRVLCYQRVTVVGDIAVEGETTVDPGGVLIVSKGSTLTFAENAQLTVNGDFLGQGTQGEPIKFVSSISANVSLQGRSSRLDHCDITGVHFKVMGVATVAGNISSDTDFAVVPNGKLAIAPGSIIRFGERSGFVVEGLFMAKGKENQKITLTSRDGTARWAGVYFHGDGVDGSVLENCILSRGHGSSVDPTDNAFNSTATMTDKKFAPPILQRPGPSPKQFGGVLCLNETSGVVVRDSVLENSVSEFGGAVYVYLSSGIEFITCTFANNQTTALAGRTTAAGGGALTVQNSYGVVFRECVFNSNHALGQWSCGGAAYIGFWAQCEFLRCRFDQNVASYVGGALYTLSITPTAKGIAEHKRDENPTWEPIGFSAVVSIHECHFQNNRGLAHIHKKRIPLVERWSNHGDEVAIDSGASASLRFATIENAVCSGPVVHIDNNDKFKHSAITIADVTIATPEEAWSHIVSFDGQSDKVDITLEGVLSYQQMERRRLKGLVGITDALLPEMQSVGGRNERYFRPREGGTVVDTVVVHHISAINWDDPAAGIDPEIRVRAMAEADTLEGPDAQSFSPILCRAILSSCGFSCHYLIARDGSIQRIVPHHMAAFHAGVSRMPTEDGRENVNEFSVGIELIAVHPDDYGRLEGGAPSRGYTREQYESLGELLAYLRGQFNIKYVVGHDEVSGPAVRKSGAKRDPGPDFDWSVIREDNGFSPRKF